MNTYIPFIQRHLKIISIGTACVMSSFALGIHSAGDVQPFTIIEAGGQTPVHGDVNGDSTVNLQDVIHILEVSQGYRTVTASALRGDPNRDGILSVDDALRILKHLTL